MKERKHGARIVSSCLTVAILLACVATAVTAWFGLRYMSPSNAGFTAGGFEPLEMKLYTVANGADETARAESPWWTDAETGDRYFGTAKPVIDGASGAAQFTLADLSFGSIDNLSRHKPENILYFCIKLPKAYGQVVHMNLHNAPEATSRSFFTLYQNVYAADGETVLGKEQVTDTTVLNAERGTTWAESLDALAAIETEQGEKFLQFSYAFAAEELEPAAIASTLTFSEDTPFLERGAARVDAKCEDAIYSSEGGHYYLYLRVTPNFEAFGHSIEYLAVIMPCYLFFRVGFAFEVDNTEPITEEATA